MRHWVVAVSLALAVLAASPARSTATPPASLAAHRAMLDRYCVTCHNQKAKTANLTFDTMDLTHVGKDAAVWERAVRKLRGGMMPPPGYMPRPDPATANSFVNFLEASLDQAALASPNPGSVALHRLNRAEYQNAMKDILGVDVDAALLLPRDDISNGLDNIANVLKVSPSFLDQYIAAAREVSRLAISHPPPTEPVKAGLARESRPIPRVCRLARRAGLSLTTFFLTTAIMTSPSPGRTAFSPSMVCRFQPMDSST